MVADALSRLINESRLEKTDEAGQFVRFIAQEATPTAVKIREIERKAAIDEKLSVIRNCVESGR